MLPVLVFFRHLVSIAVLPFTVTVIIPIWIGSRAHTSMAIGETALALASQVLGAALLLVGLALFTFSLRHFIVQGRGTLAPWDPPQHLVVEGPYRHVRNPMISGVLFILLGQAFALLSWPHGRWALLFLAINLVYIPLLEEPQLEERFREPYRDYRRHVRRFLPRLRPWRP